MMNNINADGVVVDRKVRPTRAHTLEPVTERHIPR